MSPTEVMQKLKGVKLPTQYQQFIHLSRYSRWLDSETRRESWPETVDRYLNYMCDVQCASRIPATVKAQLRENILNLAIMPSMRCMMTAGKALETENIAGFNCSYITVDSPRCFDEALYILMCGTGVGFSVERQFINKMPAINWPMEYVSDTIVVRDSKRGWAEALQKLIAMLFEGKVPAWDMSKLRPAGTPLKTFGGRASGPEPLERLFKFCVRMFENSAGRRLNSEECHDLMCMIGDIVVVGGVRRSALISLSNPSDDRMRHAKSGEWWNQTPWRSLANNSAVYTEKPDMSVFFREWHSLYESKSGERGIVNRVGLQDKAREIGRALAEFGLNPCGEIILRPNQFCNLSEVVVRPEDDLDDLKAKVQLAALIGTMQATLTKFRHVRKVWQRNTEEESLLGVSLTGQFDHAILSGCEGVEKMREWLTALREEARKANKKWAKKLDINPAAAVTCVKPSGTVSQLVDSSSGMHPRYNEHYVRRVRADKKDPLAEMMKDMKFPWEPEAAKDKCEHIVIFSFPMKSPETSILQRNLSAIEHLEIWKVYREAWCDHNPSITVQVREHEWMEVGAWVYKNFDCIGGVSFLPLDDNIYVQAPYQTIGEEEYEAMLAAMPQNVDWSRLSDYEKDDRTKRRQECTGPTCPLNSPDLI